MATVLFRDQTGNVLTYDQAFGIPSETEQERIPESTQPSAPVNNKQALMFRDASGNLMTPDQAFGTAIQAGTVSQSQPVYAPENVEYYRSLEAQAAHQPAQVQAQAPTSPFQSYSRNPFAGFGDMNLIEDATGGYIGRRLATYKGVRTITDVLGDHLPFELPGYSDEEIAKLESQYNEYLNNKPQRSQKPGILTAGMEGVAGSILPGIFESGVHGGIPGALGGAVVGGVGGSVVPGAGTVAGAMGGATTGYGLGVTANYYLQGVGDFYDALSDAGVPDEYAKPLAIAGGVPYAWIEKAQLNLLTKPFKQLGSKKTRDILLTLAKDNPEVHQIALNGLKKLGLTGLIEAGQEGVQKGTEQATVGTGQYLSGDVEGAQETFRNLPRESLAEFANTLPSSMLLPLPGTAATSAYQAVSPEAARGRAINRGVQEAAREAQAQEPPPMPTIGPDTQLAQPEEYTPQPIQETAPKTGEAVQQPIEMAPPDTPVGTTLSTGILPRPESLQAPQVEQTPEQAQEQEPEWAGKLRKKGWGVSRVGIQTPDGTTTDGWDVNINGKHMLIRGVSDPFGEKSPRTFIESVAVEHTQTHPEIAQVAQAALQSGNPADIEAARQLAVAAGIRGTGGAITFQQGGQTNILSIIELFDPNRETTTNFHENAHFIRRFFLNARENKLVERIKAFQNKDGTFNEERFANAVAKETLRQEISDQYFEEYGKGWEKVADTYITRIKDFVSPIIGKDFKQLVREMNSGKLLERDIQTTPEQQKAQGAWAPEKAPIVVPVEQARPLTGQEGAEQAAPAQQTPVPEPVTQEVTPKQPWEMTRKEFDEQTYEGQDLYGWQGSKEEQIASTLMKEADSLDLENTSETKKKAEQLRVAAQVIADTFTEQHSHKNAVKTALSENKIVRPEVLADYPDLQQTPVPPPVTQEVTPKQPWEMTREDFFNSVPDPSVNWLLTEEDKQSMHKSVITDALREGKPVPPEVLAEYPDLQQQGPAPTPIEPGGWNDYDNMGREDIVKQAKERGVKVNRKTQAIIDELQYMNENDIGAYLTHETETDVRLTDAKKYVKRYGIRIPGKEGGGIKLEDFAPLNRGLPQGSPPGMWRKSGGQTWDQWVQELAEMVPEVFHDGMNPDEFFAALFTPHKSKAEGIVPLSEYLGTGTASALQEERGIPGERQAQDIPDDEEMIPFSTLDPQTEADQTPTFFSTDTYDLIEERNLLLRRANGDPKQAWFYLANAATSAAMRGEPVNRSAIEAMRRALRMPPEFSRVLFGNIDRVEKRYEESQQSGPDEDQAMLFSTDPALQDERDLLVKRAGGDTDRAWKMYERMVAAAANRGEPVDPRKADAMRRALVGDQEQGDLFGEAAPVKEKKAFTKPVDRPVQQSLEGLDEGMLFSTAHETATESPAQDDSINTRIQQARMIAAGPIIKNWNQMHPDLAVEYQDYLQTYTKTQPHSFAAKHIKRVWPQVFQRYGSVEKVNKAIEYLKHTRTQRIGQQEINSAYYYTDELDIWAAEHGADEGMLFSTADIPPAPDPDDYYKDSNHSLEQMSRNYNEALEKYKKEIKTWADNAPDMLQFKSKDFPDYVYVISRNTYPNDKPWRVTRFFKWLKGYREHEWIPNGHDTFDTKVDAISDVALGGKYAPDIMFSTAPPTDTPQFKRWFGDSKVVDENGKPLVVYKGMLSKAWETGEEINVIDSPNGPWAGFFSSSKEVAQGFEKAFATMGDAKTLEVYLSIKKPYIVDAQGRRAKEFMFDDTVFGKNPTNPGALAAFNNGYDGIVIKNTEDEGDIYIPRSPTQIKSATGNTGAFDPTNPDIRYSTAESHPQPLGLPELERMAFDMLGSHPQIKRKMRQKFGAQIRGSFSVGGIDLRADIFIGPDIHHAYSPKKPTEEQINQHKAKMAEKHGVSEDELVIQTRRDKNGYVTVTYIRDHGYAAKTFAHEIGHADDWLPDKDMERGNLLGRIAKLSNYLKGTLDPSGNPEDALSKKDRYQIRKRAQSLASQDFDYKEDPEGFNERVKYLYAQFVQDEIGDRALYHERDTGREGTVEEGGGYVTPGIRTELMNLSAWWKGDFDRTGKDEYSKYRRSGKELYADAISVLLNAPDMLAEKAPQFYDALNNFFDKHQPMAKLYKQIQEELSQGLTPEMRLARERAMMARSSEARNKAIQNRLDQERIPRTPKEFLRSIQYDYADTTAYLPTQEAKLAVKNINYAAAQLQQYQRDMKEQVGDVMEEAGATWDDFGLYLKNRRAAGERQDMMNPGGIRGKDAKALLDTLRQDIGDEQYAAIEKAAKAMWNIRNRHIIPLLRESGLFTEELMRKIETNEEYATFSVVKYFEQHHGGDFSATIKRQIGTAEDIANPFFATVRKDGALLFAATSNIAKRTMVDQMNRYDSKNIQDAKYKWNGVTRVPQEPDNPKVYGLVRYVEDGVQKGVVVRREIADLFKHDPQNAGVVFDGLSAATGLLKSMFTANNPLFAIWNIQRDARSTLHNIPTTGLMGELTLAPELAGSYLRTIRDAYLHAFKKHSTPLMRELLEGGLVIADRQWTARDRTNVDEYERMQAEFDLKPDKIENIYQKGARAIFHDFNQMVEVWSKLAGFEYMKRKGLVDQHDMRNIMRGIIGSPDFLTRGRYTMWTNMLFLYSNAQVQGLDAAYRAVKANPVRYMMRRMAYTIIPSLIMAYLAFGDDDDDEIKDYREAFRAIPDYEKARMITFPVAWDGSKVSWIPMPQDHIGELLHGMIWNTFASDDKSLKKIFNVAVGAVPMEPGSLNPWLNLGRAAFEYAIGQNPYDLFRGRPAIDETIWRAGGFRSAEEFAKWAWNQTGGSTFGHFEPPFQARPKGTTSLPVIKPAMRRFIRTAEKQDAQEPVDTERARTLVSAKDFAAKQIRNAETEKDANPMRAYRAWRKANPDAPRSYKYTDFKRIYGNLKEKRWPKK